jgi:threonine dehydratase
MKALEPISLQEIREAQKRIAGLALRTPLIRLEHEGVAEEIYVKLENLQPIGSFKLRGAGNAMQLASKEDLSRGVITASAGNMGQGVAWNAQRLGIRCTVVVPDHAPEAKLNALRRLGANILKVTFAEWWHVIETHRYPALDGFFIHPVCDRHVIAGNGTIGLEILEDLPQTDAILVPYGGGGLSSGIASAVKALKSNTKVFACEVETAAPFSASLNAGKPVKIQYTPSFVDGIGGKSILPEMWPLVRQLLDGSIVVGLNQVADAIRLLAERNHVIAEGAGAASVAAGLTGKAGKGKTVCIVSGGNINPETLAQILTRSKESFEASA